MRDTHRSIGRPPARPLRLHQTFRARLCGFSTLTGLSELRLFQACSGSSEQGALNVLHGKAKETARSRSHVGAVAAFIGCPRDQIVVGLVMPTVPTEVLVSIIEAVAAEVPMPHAKAWLLNWRNNPERTAMAEVRA